MPESAVEDKEVRDRGNADTRGLRGQNQVCWLVLVIVKYTQTEKQPSAPYRCKGYDQHPSAELDAVVMRPVAICHMCHMPSYLCQLLIMP